MSTKIIVLFLIFKIWLIILFAFALSKELVTSSKTKIGELLYKALAIPILCFWP